LEEATSFPLMMAFNGLPEKKAVTSGKRSCGAVIFMGLDRDGMKESALFGGSVSFRSKY
jgi:hypothetical protein